MVGRLAHLLIAVCSALLRMWYHLCRLVGTRPRIVCLSRQSDEEPVDFALVRECVARTHPGHDVVTLARAIPEHGNPLRYLAYVPHVLRQVFYLATSEAAVLDSYCVAVSLLGRTLRTPVVQMWHSLGNLKKFGYAALGEPEGRSERLARLMHMHEGYDSVLISSMSFAEPFAASFGVDTTLLYEAPLPRCDLLVDPAAVAREREAIHRALPQTARRKNIVYCPTFRKCPVPDEAEAVAALVGAVDFGRYNLIYQRHPVSTLAIDDPRVISDGPAGLNLLCVADYVISDYSTIIYEAGLLDVPVYLYAYDWEAYSQERGLTIDLERDVPALLTDDPRAIMAAIEADDFDHEAFRAFTRANVALPATGTCTERVVAHVFDLAGEAGRG